MVCVPWWLLLACADVRGAEQSGPRPDPVVVQAAASAADDSPVRPVENATVATQASIQPDPSDAAPAEACSQAEVQRPQWPKRVRHKVVPRETLHQIAYRYGVEPWELRGWNGLGEDIERVKTGTRLEIKARQIPPPRKKISYTVQEGDTWWRVAARHGVDSKDLRSYNWPYRGKMEPGRTLSVWVDPIVYAWLQQVPPDFDQDDSAQIRAGGLSVGRPSDGRLIGGVPIPEEPGWEIRFPGSAYGSTYAVTELRSVLRRFRDESGYEGVIRVGTMSNPRGGLVGHHKSHQSGRDVDIRLPRKVGVPRGVPLTLRRIDWVATWKLLETVVHSDIVVVFLDYSTQRRVYRAAKAAGVPESRLAEVLQYPRGSHARVAPVRHSSGHDKHMHVRFACGPCEVECMQTTSSGDDEP